MKQPLHDAFRRRRRYLLRVVTRRRLVDDHCRLPGHVRLQATQECSHLACGNAPVNMAIVRHTALNLLSGARPTTSLKNRRKKAGWNVDYRETVLRQTA
jgi:hypothetical protein